MDITMEKRIYQKPVSKIMSMTFNGDVCDPTAYGPSLVVVSEEDGRYKFVVSPLF